MSAALTDKQKTALKKLKTAAVYADERSGVQSFLRSGRQKPAEAVARKPKSAAAPHKPKSAAAPRKKIAKKAAKKPAASPKKSVTTKSAGKKKSAAQKIDNTPKSEVLPRDERPEKEVGPIDACFLQKDNRVRRLPQVQTRAPCRSDYEKMQQGQRRRPRATKK